MGQFTLPSTPICIYREPIEYLRDQISRGVILDGIDVTVGSSVRNVYHCTAMGSSTSTLSQNVTGAMTTFPSIGVSVTADDYGSQEIPRPIMTIDSSVFTDKEKTPFTFNTFTEDSSGYRVATIVWRVCFNSSLTTGYIYARIEKYEYYGVSVLQGAYSKIAAPTSITFDKIAF